MELDYAIGWDFVDISGRPFQLRFRIDRMSEDPYGLDGTGQLIAVIVDGNRPDCDTRIAISRPGVAQAAIDDALEGWQDWAHLVDNGFHRWISLAAIRHRVAAAGLGFTALRDGECESDQQRPTGTTSPPRQSEADVYKN